MRALLFIIGLTFMSVPAFSAGLPKVGDIIPHTLELSDQNGNQQDFGSVVGEKGAVLVFFRSANWCPYCQKQLIELSSKKQFFDDAGYSLVGISYDPVKVLKKFDTKRSQGFSLLSDTDSEAIESFGILNTEHKVGSFAYGVPYPTIFVVNKDKTIKAILAEEGYKSRPEVQDILDALN